MMTVNNGTVRPRLERTRLAWLQRVDQLTIREPRELLELRLIQHCLGMERLQWRFTQTPLFSLNACCCAPSHRGGAGDAWTELRDSSERQPALMVCLVTGKVGWAERLGKDHAFSECTLALLKGYREVRYARYRHFSPSTR
jgi:hypothetical protein